ncbi:MAG: DUF6351 family protein [Novosphingobium sp.]|nr:DUF6351 family protein [Novosphingobium sp.]
MKITSFRAALCSVVAAAGFACAASASEGAGLRVFSSRADMVSGDEALVEFPSRIDPKALSISLNGPDITKALHVEQSDGRTIALVGGLKPGKNLLEVGERGKARAKLEITVYPRSGPIFSGPHQKPFICQTNEFELPITGGNLGPPLDSNCSIETRVDYVYKATDGALKALPNPSLPPADVARTTTKDGREVNFIVRVETGTVNRSIYQIAILHDPSVDPAPDPWHRPSGWNGRLIYNFGGGCRAAYQQGRSISFGYHSGKPVPMGKAIVEPDWLGLGYATAGATLTTWQNNCNDVTSAETAMMVKERFIEHYGPVAHVMGSGGSGGAMQQFLIAQNYPGILDGIMVQATHPDYLSYNTSVVSDAALLDRVFSLPDLKGLTDDQQTAIGGFANWKVIGKSWLGFSPGWNVPNGASCASPIPNSLIYDREKNPRGVRCTIVDNMINVYGRDPKTGFARTPLDNVGVQYGLTAFNAGEITAEQFIVLNEKIGGYDVDGRFVGGRTTGDPEAIRIAYATGRVAGGGGGLASTPILNTHTYVDEFDHHSRADIFMSRDRLIAANGDAGNMVTITLPSDRNLDRVHDIVRLPNKFLLKMEEWLDNIARDPAVESHEKTVRNKPADLLDGCELPDGRVVNEMPSYSGPGKCNAAYPSHGTPRTAAGAPIALDILKCALKPFDAKAYSHPITVAQAARLQAVFPNGVCDYTRKGVGQLTKLATWLRY